MKSLEWLSKGVAHRERERERERERSEMLGRD
jgi:hypothetical protein